MYTRKFIYYIIYILRTCIIIHVYISIIQTYVINKYMYSNTIINQVQIQINFKCNNLTN